MFNRKFNRNLLGLKVNTFFEGEGDPPTPTPPTPPKTFTQDQVNQFLTQRISEEHQKYQKSSQQTIDQLKALQAHASTTEEQKSQLQIQIDNLTTQFNTKEQQLAKQVKDWETKYNTDITGIKKEAESWREKFEGNVKNVAIVNAATQFKAYNPAQIESILSPITKVVEEPGPDGKPTGNLVPMVAWQSTDKEGKRIMLQLSVPDAVKAMTETPDLYGNLFRSDANGGLGGSTTGGRGASAAFTQAEVESMSVDDYAKNRGAIHKQVG